MLLNLTVYDAAQKAQGAVQMRLDWDQHTWSIAKDDDQAWDGVGFSTAGAFEAKSWGGVIWLWDQVDGDQKHNTVIFRDGPTGESDSDHTSGTARIFDPQDPAFKDGEIQWTVDDAGASDASTDAGGSAQPSMPAQPSARRKKVLEVILPAVVNSAYPDARFLKLVGKATPQTNPAPYTTCGTLPAYIAIQLGGTGKIAAGGMGKLREAGQDANAWVVADLVKRPRPGDLFGLLYPGATDRVNGDISHVGVILDASGDQWKTADAGQSDGKLIGWTCLAITRNYDAQTGILSDDIRLIDQKHRVLAGWIDIDAFPFPALATV